MWLAHLDYAYGVDAIRGSGRGAHSVAVLVQLDLEAWRRKAFPKSRNYIPPKNPQGLDWAQHLFRW